MSLRDVVSSAGLTLFPLVALVFFFVVFVGILAYVVLRKRESWDRVRRLPLQDDDPPRAQESNR